MAEFPHKEVVEDFDPGYGWTEDSNSHHLLIDLPGFEKHQIKINVDNGRLKVSGKRLAKENKYEQFENIFEVPENTDLSLGGIQANFDGKILIITIPKHEVEEPEPASVKGEAEARTEPAPDSVKDQNVVPKHEAEARTEPEPDSVKDQDVVPKHEAEARTEPEPDSVKNAEARTEPELPDDAEARTKLEPDSVKDQNVVPKHEAEARTEPEPDSVKNAEARTEPELPDDAEARTKLEPDSVQDKIFVPRHEVEEEKQLEPAGIKDEGVSKHEEEEKESKPNGIKDPSVVLKHGAEEEKESEPVGVKSQDVNGSTKENIHEKPNDNVLGTGSTVCESKKEEGSLEDAIVCSPERAARRQEGEPGYLRSVMETLSKNKRIIAVTAIVAFSLGMFTSMKIQGREKKAP